MPNSSSAKLATNEILKMSLSIIFISYSFLSKYVDNKKPTVATLKNTVAVA
jgi:hypothetical protein